MCTSATLRVFCVALHTLDMFSCEAKICISIERHATRAPSSFKRNPSTRHYGLTMVTRGGAWVTRLNTIRATPIHNNPQLEMGSPSKIIQLHTPLPMHVICSITFNFDCGEGETISTICWENPCCFQPGHNYPWWAISHHSQQVPQMLKCVFPQNTQHQHWWETTLCTM